MCPGLAKAVLEQLSQCRRPSTVQPGSEEHMLLSSAHRCPQAFLMSPVSPLSQLLKKGPGPGSVCAVLAYLSELAPGVP